MSLTGVEELNKKTLSSKFNYALDTGVIGDTPYLLLDTLYNLGEGSEKVSGVLKGLSARTDQSLQVCVHNEMGYRDTFKDVFSSFVQAFIASENNPEFFQPIYKLSINGIPMGYSREKYSTDEEGDISLVNDSAMMIPVDASSIARTDNLNTSWSHPDGALINASEYSIENGALTSDFALAYSEDSWKVDGTLQGKEVKSNLQHNSWLASGYGSYLEAAKLASSEQESSEFHMWTPEVDPTEAMKVVLSKIKDDPNANFKLDLGPMVMKFLSDENGIINQAFVEQGGMTLRLELMHVSGEPVLK